MVETGAVGEERTEIELTSGDGARSDSPFARPAGDGADSSMRGGTNPDGRRLLAVGVVVGIVGLVLGWVLGRSGADQAVPAVAATATVVASDPIEPIESVTTEPPATASTVAGATPITSSPAADDVPFSADGVVTVVEGEVAVADELAGQPLEIVAFGNGRQLMRLDLQTTMLTSLVASEMQPFGRPRLVIGDDWVLLPTFDRGFPSTIVFDDHRVEPIEVGPSFQIAGTTDGEAIWLLSSSLVEGGAGAAELAALDGERLTGITLPAMPRGFDPSGGFVVDVPGGWFQVTGDGAVRITDGELLALGRSVAVAQECDDELRCAVNVIDREMSERRALDLDLPLVPGRQLTLALVGGESVSPDGRSAFIEVVNPIGGAAAQPTLGVVDLESGEVTVLGAAQDIDQVVWTPDSRFVLFIQGGRIVAHDRDTGDEIMVADELIAIDAFGVRRTQPAGGP